VILFEKAFHLRDKIGNWNIAVQEWLRKCVYERLPYSKSTNQLLTFMVSAFWHGYYIGYYITFGLYTLQIVLGNQIYKFSKENKDHVIIKLYRKTEPVSFLLAWLVWNWIFVVNSAYFILLSFDRSFEILKKMYFGVPIFLFGALIFFKWINKKGKYKDIRTD
jgi:lysophospholipid acyltransferase